MIEEAPQNILYQCISANDKYYIAKLKKKKEKIATSQWSWKTVPRKQLSLSHLILIQALFMNL